MEITSVGGSQCGWAGRGRKEFARDSTERRDHLLLIVLCGLNAIGSVACPPRPVPRPTLREAPIGPRRACAQAGATTASWRVTPRGLTFLAEECARLQGRARDLACRVERTLRQTRTADSFATACDRGRAIACNVLGVLLDRGLVTVRSLARARICYKAACRAHYPSVPTWVRQWHETKLL